MFTKKTKEIKLGITYSLFVGEELLEASVKSIRKNVDYINVVYQNYSWVGNLISDNAIKVLEELKSKGLIDKIILYKFNDFENKDKLPLYCLEKKTMGVKDLLANKCSHAMFMDVDEFYKSDEFASAKKFVIENNITHSFCSIYDYKLSPIYRQKDVNAYAVPFIYKIDKSSFLSQKNNSPCRVDSLRSLFFDHKKHKAYYLNNIVMHHMTGIRKNFNDKLDNTITNMNEKGREFVKKFGDRHNQLSLLDEDDFIKQGYIKVENIFNI